MFSVDMRIPKALNLRLALLLALILPLQALAAISGCEQFSVGQLADTHCEHGAPAVQHHCGTCCCIAAIGLAPQRWTAPRPESLSVSLPLFQFPPWVTLDRLDRPPRVTLR
jgi:hypothetical protein